MAIQLLLSEILPPHLPALRRLMRAIAGDQQTGDQAVADLLQTLVDAPDLLDLTLEPRIALTQLMLQTWNNSYHPPSSCSEPGDSTLVTLTPYTRQAFLLVSLEKFTHEEAALILSVHPDKIHALIERAGMEIAAKLASDVLIIEDESLIAMELKMIMSSLGHKVRGIARTHNQALEEVQRHKPDLILADIKLADGSSGVEAVADILRWLSVPVIFITSYPERLLTGTRPEPTYLVTKPFQRSLIEAVVSQALFFSERASMRATG